MKLYDIFTFFNELELLEIRFNILNNYVDYFVIVEATETFSGLPKKLFFEENKHLFKKYQHKIIHHITDDTPSSIEDLRARLSNPNLSELDRNISNYTLSSKNIPQGQPHWLREFYQKETMKKPLLNLADDDICFVSDIDEIWNPKVIINYTEDGIYKFKQQVHTYYLNNRSNEHWAGTFVTKYKNIKNNSLNRLDTLDKLEYNYIKKGGWHFTNLGGVEKIKTKIESYGHQEFNNNGVKSQIEERLLKNQDFIGRSFKFWTDENDLPEYILNNRNKYSRLFRADTFKKKINAKKGIISTLERIKCLLFRLWTKIKSILRL